LQVKRLEHEVGYVRKEDGTEIGPVFLGKALVELLEIGDVLDIKLGWYGPLWRVLESGDISAKSQWSGL
jgi:hypothetical protein